MSKLKIAVAMSGGVDSSLAASLLVEAGHEVVGVYLDCWGEPGCGIDENRKDAIRVSLKLGISMKVLDFKKEYKERVMDWFFEEVEAGRTPNPDVLCNKEIKFGLFLDWAMKNNFDMVATGHYARLGKDERRLRTKYRKVRNPKRVNCKLYQAKDKHKDQTYFLAMVERSKFERVVFPIGGMLKSEVRREAKKRGDVASWFGKSCGGYVVFEESRAEAV
ncbi:MAG: hypothetical protein ABIJ43_03290 [Candidatus Beckwithbacteria bacterium]|nr:hypothetical protein [Patescibacteria group bacterium]